MNVSLASASQPTVPKPISAADAAHRYDALGHGSWREHSLPGICLAVQAELAEQLAHAAELQRKRDLGLRADADRKLPEWAFAALPECAAMAQAMDAPSGLLGALRNPLLLWAVAVLCRTGNVAGWYRHLDAAARAELEKAVVQLGRRPPAQNAALQMFYLGTRLHFRTLGRGEPKPREMTLLAAARQLETITDGLDAARRLWERRVNRWIGHHDLASLRARTDATPTQRE